MEEDDDIGFDDEAGPSIVHRKVFGKKKKMEKDKISRVNTKKEKR